MTCRLLSYLTKIVNYFFCKNKINCRKKNIKDKIKIDEDLKSTTKIKIAIERKNKNFNKGLEVTKNTRSLIFFVSIKTFLVKSDDL